MLVARKRVLGDAHPDTLFAASNPANTYSNQAKYGEAEKLRVEVLATMRRVLGPDHPDTLAAAGNLANMKRIQGN